MFFPKHCGAFFKQSSLTYPMRHGDKESMKPLFLTFLEFSPLFSLTRAPVSRNNPLWSHLNEQSAHHHKALQHTNNSQLFWMMCVGVGTRVKTALLSSILSLPSTVIWPRKQEIYWNTCSSLVIDSWVININDTVSTYSQWWWLNISMWNWFS